MVVSQAGHFPDSNFSGTHIFSARHDDTGGHSMSISAFERLTLLQQVEGAHTIQFHTRETPERQLPAEAFTCTIPIRNGPPIKTVGATEEEAKEKAAEELLKAIDRQEVQFNAKHALEHQKHHESKYQSKNQKGKKPKKNL